MTKSIIHHPSDETLAAHAQGALDEGRRILVATHIQLCPSCRGVAQALDDLAGAALDGLDATSVDPGALGNVLSQIADAARPPAHAAASSRKSQAIELPMQLKELAAYEVGPWRWIGPGVYRSTTNVPFENGARVFLLRAAPGTSLPEHTHTGSELTLILKGAFAHVGGRFGVGDFEEADGETEHQPVVEPGEECICLVAMQGEIKLLGLLGRLLQPFVRM